MKSGVELAVQAFFINDPYYPRPLSNKAAQQSLWKAFKVGYMQASDWALAKAEKHEKALPAMFLDACRRATKASAKSGGSSGKVSCE
jgi:hypothetical protein